MSFSISQVIQLEKTISWTIISSSITFLVTWAITGSWQIGVTISVTERIIKLFVYYGHERWWHKRYKSQKQEAKDSEKV